MSHYLLNKLTAAACALALLLSLIPCAAAAGTPASSSNISKQDYGTYGSTVKSYLYENGNGGLTRVEYVNGTIVVEDYDSSFSLRNSRTVPMELSLWGGFYAGKDSNYLIFGQKNPSESSSVEVIRVVKYSKDWQRLGQTSVMGAYTMTPFDGGSLRCAEYGGYLYIRCARKMFRTVQTMYGPLDTGTNHQANLTLEVRESDMKLVDSYDQIWNLDFGYVSHSFNQFLLIDQDRNIVGLDHSDSDSQANGRSSHGYAKDVKARGAVLIRYDEKAGQDHFKGSDPYQWCSYSLVQGFAGASGSNNTGASLGGFAETTGGYVSAFNYDGAGGSGARNVYLGFTTKSGLSSSVKKVSAASGVTTPVLAPTGLGGGYVMWNGKSGYSANSTLYYAAYGADGQPGQVQTANGSLSDCQPISYNGKVVWYVTSGSGPVFYTLDSSGVQSHPTDAGAVPSAPSASTTPTAPSTSTTPTAPSTSTTPTTPTTPTKPAASTNPGSSSSTSQKTNAKYQMGEMVEIGDPGCKHYFIYGNPHETIASTCTSEGYVILICPHCGAKKVYGVLTPLGHKYVNGVCKNCGEADPNAPAPKTTQPTTTTTPAASTTPKNPAASTTPTTTTTPTTPTTPTTSTTPGTASSERSAEEEKAYAAMTAMKSQYPEGTRWTNSNSYDWKGGIFSGGAGCAGFAFMLSDAAFGSLPARKVDQVSLSDVRVGDILRNGGDTHSVIVLEVQSDGVVVAEGNFNDSVHWGRKLSRSEAENSSYLLTRWPQESAGTPSETDKPAAAPGTSPANPFTDVPEGSYYHDAVLWALANGVTTGVTKTEFRPNAACTRGQVVTFLWRAKGSPEPVTKTNPFRDVSSSSPFYKAILWAYENDITTGKTATSFNPGGTCTSAHVVTFLWRANGEPAASGSSSLANSYNSGSYYTKAVAWADTNGLLSGVGSAFSPSQTSPRANIVTYLYRDIAL